MGHTVRASVARATYNGETFLREQIDSILNMLSQEDELVISDDGSKDRTEEIIREYMSRDNRVIFVKNPDNHGVCGNFSNAIQHCKGRYIFMSDQDDVWFGDKINRMIAVLEENNADLAVHDGYITNQQLEPRLETMFQLANSTTSPWANFVHGRFWGCCMVFRSEATRYLLPFPNVARDFPHDIFAPILAGLKGGVCMTEECFIYHRIHDRNVTPTKKNSMMKIIKNRIQLLLCVVKRLLKIG